MPEGNNNLLYLDVKQFTDDVTVDENFEVTGKGILDVLMTTATKHLKAQLDAGRIRGEDYATAYVQVYTTTLQAALQAWLQKAIADKQEDLIDAQIATEKAKTALHRRQIEGFDEDYIQKILKICVDAWGVGFSVAKDNFEATGIPAVMQKVSIDDLYNKFVITNLDKYNYGRDYLEEITK